MEREGGRERVRERESEREREREREKERERERERDLSRMACILVVGKSVQEFEMATTERGMSDSLLIV